MSETDKNSDLPEDIPTSSNTTRRHTICVDSSARCDICGSEADGIHYNALSCRSCTAFFRRSITYKQKYTCRNDNNCPINQHDRCVCRWCRLQACFRAGMTADAVRPQREPTGSQKRRNTLKNIRKVSTKSVDSFQIMKQSPAYSETTIEPVEMKNVDDQAEFDRLVDLYSESLKHMHRSLQTTDDFLNELTNGVKYTAMGPEDVDRLAAVELGGLCYWIEKLDPFINLPADDRSTLFKRYSVRKLSLDHFFIASKFPEFAQQNVFMMNNSKFVPSYLTGFETTDDTETSRKAKFRLLRPTIDLALSVIIRPFYEMEICEVEIVALQILLMWSTSNQQHVSKETCKIMDERRNWVINKLYQHYLNNNYPDPMIRLGEVVLMLCEIEVICNYHCKDFQVAQLFKCGKLDQYWYDQVCYSDINTAE